MEKIQHRQCAATTTLATAKPVKPIVLWLASSMKPAAELEGRIASVFSVCHGVSVQDLYARNTSSPDVCAVFIVADPVHKADTFADVISSIRQQTSQPLIAVVPDEAPYATLASCFAAGAMECLYYEDTDARTLVRIAAKINSASNCVYQPPGTDQQSHLVQAIVETSPIILHRWVLDADQRICIEYISQNISQLGYSSEELRSGKIQWLDLVASDDLPRLQQQISAHIQNNEQDFICRYRITTRDGEQRWLEDNGKISRDESGQIKYFQGCIVDITDLIETQEKLSDSVLKAQLMKENASRLASEQQIYLDTIDLAIAIYDKNQCLQLSNKLMRDWWGFTIDYVASHPHISSIIPSNFHQGLYSFPQSQLDGYVADRIARMKSGKRHEMIIKRGNDKIFSFTINPLENGGSMFTFFDLTELKKNQRKLLAQRKQLVENEQRYRALYDAADRNHRELLLLEKLNAAISSKLDPTELRHTATSALRALIDFDLIELRNPQGFSATGSNAASHTGTDSIISTVIQETIDSRDFCLRHSDDAAITDMPNESSVIAIPLLDRSRLMAILLVVNTQAHLRTCDCQLLIKIAAQLSVALQNAELHQQLKIELRRSRAMSRLSKKMNYADKQPTLLRAAVETAASVIAGGAAAFHPFGTSANLQTCSSANYQSIAPERHRKMLRAACDLRAPAELANSDIAGANSAMSVMLIPLLQQNDLLGFLEIQHRDPRTTYSARDRTMLASIGNQLSLAIQRQNLLSQVEYMAYHDSLTGLPNRRRFEHQLKIELEKATGSGTHLAVMFIDLDGFKTINDNLGHPVGDQLLVEFTKLLNQNTGDSDLLARVGGDEFAIIVTDINKSNDAMRIANRYLHIMEREIMAGTHQLIVGASIGVSVYPQDGQTTADLLRHADAAMYQAKKEGKNTARVFSPYLAARSRERMNTKFDLHHALKNGELELHYQPQIDVQCEHWVGLEALLRWNHPRRGLMSPLSFIPVAEESGLILPIGSWVLQQACEQTVKWHQQGHTELRIAVNISAVQFEQQNFVNLVRDTLDATRLPADKLELEVTESVVMQDINKVVTRLKKLRALGVNIAIDDFGTGYSSLQYLQELPLDALKIDRAFINSLDCSKPHMSLISSIIELARVADLRTVAEGIERVDQLQALRTLGCNEAQGFLFAKPASAQQLTCKLPPMKHATSQPHKANRDIPTTA